MARTKKTAAEAVAETAAEAAIKKTAKKTAAAPKKTVVQKAEAVVQKAEANVYIQFNGSEISAETLVEKAKELSGVKSPKTVDVYVKPEENKVYFVVDEVSDSFDLC